MAMFGIIVSGRLVKTKFHAFLRVIYNCNILGANGISTNKSDTMCYNHQ